MLNDKYVIGVCITKIHDLTRSDLMSRMHYKAAKHGYKLIVFNSLEDFYLNDAFDVGSKAIYNIINYDIVDALVIHSESFYNQDIRNAIIDGAKSSGCPVVLVGDQYDGCFSVIGDYDDQYTSIIDHVIREHGATDTCYIAGKKDNDPTSERRLACYKRALEQNGLPFDESRIGYGEYWEDPTNAFMDKLLSSGNKLPQAIFCANDYMAFAVCNRLKNAGYSIPRDVIVTGFDGIPAANHFNPRLTTCAEDIEHLAELTIESVRMALEAHAPVVSKNEYIPCISESCGCQMLSDRDFRDVAAQLYHTIDSMEKHEDFIYGWTRCMMNIKDMNSLYSLLSGCMLENSYICLNSNFIASVIDGTGDRLGSTIFDSLIIIPSRYSIAVSDKIDEMKLSDMIPDIDAWAQDGTTVILNAIYADEVVCGYYAYKTDNIYGTMHKLKRVLNTVNIAFDVAINYFRRENMRREVEHAAHTNAITKLPNLKGAVKWFESFSDSENRSKSLSISVYSMPKYTYILENYGIADIEEAVSFVAQTLQLANPSNCYIAHISEDEFTVINYYDDPNEIGDTINRATSVFFSAIESYNTDSSKEYFVEVNCGCTVVSPGWSGSLESFIKFANSEMYMNRLKSGEGKAVKQQVASKDYYKAFDLLIQKNLFTYHFQPIVSAKTGDIVAYEALMRTDASIGMNPLEVIDAAKNYRKLYEIEKATLFNVMARYAADREKFGDKKVFINSLPGHFLNDEDKGRLIELHSAYMDRFVFELTEENSVSDEELERIKYFGSTETQIAIDDYGTGHSNIVNLMRYTPHVIKIDRFLISDIHKNQNKQLFVRNIIEFAKINNILVLAEGVETSNELNTVIDLGVDLIQGYYTARPAPDPIAAIAEDIRREIISANPLFGQEE